LLINESNKAYVTEEEKYESKFGPRGFDFP